MTTLNNTSTEGGHAWGMKLSDAPDNQQYPRQSADARMTPGHNARESDAPDRIGDVRIEGSPAPTPTHEPIEHRHARRPNTSGRLGSTDERVNLSTRSLPTTRSDVGPGGSR